MLGKIINWIFSPTQKPIIENHIDLYSKLVDLEEKYNSLLLDVKRLEEENIETTNELYRLENSLDARIDILAEKCRIDYDV
jgi:hypothetical protein